MDKNRISRDEMLLRISEVVAKRSTCLRLPGGIGAVLAIDSRPISIGYAGAEPGAPHCDPGGLCDLSKPCTRTVHAEDNAIRFAESLQIDLSLCTLYCTISPCEKCAKLILEKKIDRVVFRSQYRLPTGATLLRSFGVKVDWVP